MDNGLSKALCLSKVIQQEELFGTELHFMHVKSTHCLNLSVLHRSKEQLECDLSKSKS